MKISVRCGATSPGKTSDAGCRCRYPHHRLVFIEGSRLSRPAHEALTAAIAGGDLIHIPSICLVELTYLVEKGRLPSAARDALIEALDDPTGPCTLVPLDRLVAEALRFIQRTEVPDLPDRIIAATALATRLPLISRDRKIRASHLQTIW